MRNLLTFRHPCNLKKQDNNLHNQSRTLTTIIFMASLLLTACGPQVVTPSSQSAVQSAVLGKPTGDVNVQPTVEEDFISAIEGYVLNEGGRVQTGEDGRVRLDLSSGTILRVGPTSLFKLEANTPADDGLITTISLELGRLWVILNGGQLKVDTDSGQATVRGSYMSVDFKDGLLRLTCLEGTCTFQNETGDYTIPAGSKLETNGAGEVPVISVMSEEEIQEWLAANPEAAEIVAALKAAATVTFTTAPSATSIPEATFTPAPTGTSTPPASLGGAVDSDLLSCRYGPGASYLYQYGLSRGEQVEVIGKAETTGGLWLYVKNNDRERPCWVNARFIQVEGDASTLAQIYPEQAPLILFFHDRFPPVTNVEASRSGDSVYVQWTGYELALGDRESAESPQYLVEFWTCQGGQIVFTAYGAFEEAAVVQDEAGCGEPSHGHVFIAHKDGYVGPVAIPWPAQ
jgi:hypothetical protein